MDAKAHEETARPLGVLQCLLAGFEMLGHNLWLLVLPVALDLFLWLGPRLSVAPLLQRYIGFLQAQSTLDPQLTIQIAQLADVLGELGEQFNLFWLVRVLPALNMPSLLTQTAAAAISPLGERSVLLVDNLLVLMGWTAVLVPFGLIGGFIYLNGVARTVRVAWPLQEQPPADQAPAAKNAGAGRVAEAQETQGAGTRRLSSGVSKFIRVSLFSGGLLGIAVVFALPWLFLLVAVMAASQFGFWLLVFCTGLMAGYAAIHLLFVVPGVLVGNRGLLRAVWESIVLIHTDFPGAMGLAILMLILYRGLALAWLQPTGDSWYMLIGIVGNSCIATALTAAAFVFYKERTKHLVKKPAPAQGTSG